MRSKAANQAGKRHHRAPAAISSGVITYVQANLSEAAAFKRAQHPDDSGLAIDPSLGRAFRGAIFLELQ